MLCFANFNIIGFGYTLYFIIDFWKQDLLFMSTIFQDLSFVKCPVVMVVPNYAWLQTFLRGRTSWQKHPWEIICLAKGATFSILEILYFREIKRMSKIIKMRGKTKSSY